MRFVASRGFYTTRGNWSINRHSGKTYPAIVNDSPPQLTSYQQTIRELSERLVEAQRAIRILDAIKWDTGIEQAFFASGCSELPKVDQGYYAGRSPGFDPAAKRKEFYDLERDVVARLGSFNPVGGILRRMCREYQLVVHMLENRGLAEFSQISQELYGSAGDVFHAGDPTLADFGVMMFEALTNIHDSRFLEDEEKSIDGPTAVGILQQRLHEAFGEGAGAVRVKLSDGIVSDAAAGTDYIKIRADARFSQRDLRLMEIHEGWVHVGTTLNGMHQPICTFLSKGPPSSTVTQEGLAILMEVLAFASHPARLRRVTNRIRAVHMAERGANFIEVFSFFREQGLSDQESYVNAYRVFRGSTPDNGPFTKDISYSKGFILVYDYVQLAVQKGLLSRVPLLFCGKTTLEDMRTMAQLVDEGLVTPPKHLPPQIADMNALAAWMCYSNFLNRLNLGQVEADYAGIL